MTPTIESVPDLNQVVSLFENAWQADGGADLLAFLPPRDHAHYHRIACELVRIDLEMWWTRGVRKHLNEYRQDLPHLFRDPTALQELAFEEYRQRAQAGENVEPDEYRTRFGVDVSGWPPAPLRPAIDSQLRTRVVLPPPDEAGFLKTMDVRAAIVADLRRSIPDEADDLDHALGRLPSVGDRVFGFELVEELGEGAFAKVFRARQSDLADRPVALKVALSLNDEPRKLARLQHTNIVPIYSTHKNANLHAVCMPYLGSLTLDHLLKSMTVVPGSLPRSGRELLSTLFERQSATLEQRSRPAAGGAEKTVSPAPSPHAATPILDMMAAYTHADAVLWMAARIADGLAHAHDRSILHLDLKPANVLLTDDGQPMVLDFNLAIDLNGGDAVAKSRLGGTLPYMSPEQLEAFDGGARKLDGRSDLFSLGVLLYELLTGTSPYPKRYGEMRQVVAALREDRRRRPQSPRTANPEITPAVESIVLKLLEPDRAHRYQTATQVREDLERQLANLPLLHAPDRSVVELAVKWYRRHPRWAIGGLVAMVAGLTMLLPLSVLAVRQSQIAARKMEVETAEARQLWGETIEEAQAVQVLLATRSGERTRLEEGLSRGRALLDRYGIGTDMQWPARTVVARLPAGEQAALRLDCGELLLFMADAEETLAGYAPDPADKEAGLKAALHWSELAAASYIPSQVPQRLIDQREEILRAIPGDSRPELIPLLPAERAAEFNAYHSGVTHARAGRYREALKQLVPFTEDHPRHFQSWFVRGVCHDHLEQNAEALACWAACLALGRDRPQVYFNRGLVCLREKDYARAEADFGRAVAGKPGWPEALMNRAITRKEMGAYTGAAEDLTAVLAVPGAPVRARFLLGEVKQLANQPEEAKREFAAALQATPRNELDWSTRGYSRMTTAPAEALADLDRALALNPRSREALFNKSLILSDHLNRPRDAIAVLDRFLEFYPDSIDIRLNRGVVLARVGECKKARTDAEHCLARMRTPFLVYQAAGVYAQISHHEPTSDARKEALALLATAFQKGFNDLEMVRTDIDLDPLRGDPEFKRLVQAATGLTTTR